MLKIIPVLVLLLLLLLLQYKSHQVLQEGEALQVRAALLLLLSH
jgi:hypothetical protein